MRECAVKKNSVSVPQRQTRLTEVIKHVSLKHQLEASFWRLQASKQVSCRDNCCSHLLLLTALIKMLCLRFVARKILLYYLRQETFASVIESCFFKHETNLSAFFHPSRLMLYRENCCSHLVMIAFNSKVMLLFKVFSKDSS